MSPRMIHYAIAVAVCLLPNSTFAQYGSVPADAQDAIRRATRIMRNVDKGGNGLFEEAEAAGAWKPYQHLDTNRDGLLSLEEMSTERFPYLETGGERILNVVYKQVGDRKLHLDLYYPTGADSKTEALPLIVYTHGGGWSAGSKQGIANGSFRDVFLLLIKRGFAVASVNYRLCDREGNIRMRDCVIDSKDAVRYLAKNSDEFRLDPQRFFAMGDSAGGHIAQMLLLTTPELLLGDESLANARYNMVAGISWYGPSDFENVDLFNHDDRPDFRDRFGARILGANSDSADKLSLYREMSPVNYLTALSPPLLMIQGDKDTTIPVKHAYYMEQKAVQVDAPVEIMIIKNSGHNWRRVDADIEPTREEIIERTVQFFIDQVELE
ncbi:alpha/beta hydrolase [Rubinisphaera brasiliensis]|uniref:Lipase/esterase n=1 Tax=Rubinisphaera brasiliensis (strain ATCC 49424 / DSM 5305 / JCM 21570 / IAM 15109 / NBRC 103401 / IFAM 1448) TaxID=756272 RepID=F0STK0_RUBBR|nr:alpha/beta hydrolase [Rubinisphaera brasiliensis]ADY61469.1 lipase/esterase [Rubinisphaera brasiliensis DSM 5305]